MLGGVCTRCISKVSILVGHHYNYVGSYVMEDIGSESHARGASEASPPACNIIINLVLFIIPKYGPGTIKATSSGDYITRLILIIT